MKQGLEKLAGNLNQNNQQPFKTEKTLYTLDYVICSIAANAQTFRHLYDTTDDARWTQGQDVKAQIKSNTKASWVIRDSDANRYQ